MPKSELREVVFMGAVDPHTPVAQGWLRAPHRKLDAKLSAPHRPYHTHDERQPLKPGEVVPLDIALWPTSIVVPAGYRIALSVRGRDYEWQKHTGCACRISGTNCSAAARFCMTIRVTGRLRFFPEKTRCMWARTRHPIFSCLSFRTGVRIEQDVR